MTAEEEEDKESKYNTDDDGEEDGARRSTDEDNEEPGEDTEDWGEEGEQEEHTGNKLTKAIKAKKSAAKKLKDSAKQKVVNKLQVLIAIGLVVLVIGWSKFEDFTYWVSGVEEVTVVSKTTEHGCWEITDSSGDSYCVDEESYNTSYEGTNYLLDDKMSPYKLRTVR